MRVSVGSSKLGQESERVVGACKSVCFNEDQLDERRDKLRKIL